MENGGENPDPLLWDEVRTFTRYLVQMECSQSIAERYKSAIATLNLDEFTSEFELSTLKLASTHWFITGCLDAACALLYPRSLLRRRIYTLAALLETSPEYTECYLSSGKGPLYVAALVIVNTCLVTLQFISGCLLIAVLKVTK